MKKLGIGIQTFSKLLRENCVYVDKTEDIYELITQGSYYFLSRPRRFGKSLLVSTLREIFEGNQESFQGFWIYDKIEWRAYPIIHIDFSVLDYSQFSLSDALNKRLSKIAKEKEIHLEFKMESADDAIKQIHKKKYYEKYQGQEKEIVLIGIAFGKKERNVKEWSFDKLKKEN